MAFALDIGACCRHHAGLDFGRVRPAFVLLDAVPSAQTHR
jgi:hypothetical protein